MNRELSGIKQIELILKSESIDYQKEYKFHPVRKWRFDFAILGKIYIAIEFEGGTWVKGAHVRGAKYSRDCEKYNTAQIMGWKVFRYTIDMLRENPEQVIKNIKLCGD